MLQIWNKYIKHLESISIDFPIQLNPPLAESELNTIDLERNNQLLQLLSIFNGQNTEFHPILFGFRFLTAKEVINSYKPQSEQVNIPFAIDFNNNYLLIDKLNNTVYFDNGKKSFFVAHSIYDLIATLIDYMEFGFFTFDKTKLSFSIENNIPFPISLHNELKDQLVVSKDSLFHHLKSNWKTSIHKGFQLIEDDDKSLQYKIENNKIVFFENKWDSNHSFCK